MGNADRAVFLQTSLMTRIQLLAQVMPELVQDYPDTYANMGIHDPGDKMFARYVKITAPSQRAAYSTPPVAEIPPRDAYATRL